MMTSADLTAVPSDPLVPFTDQLRLAVAAYLARFTGLSRQHTESDLRCYLSWCAKRGLDPLAARRPHLELYIRWMQEIRYFKPSTVSRRFSVTAGFCRNCVIDGLLEHSPAEHVRRPAAPAESPTLGFTHLQFERCLPPPASPLIRVRSRWWPCLACWACGSSKPQGPTSPISARSTATGCCGYAARGPRSS
jgi:integrase/recombinase XerD